MTTAQEATAAPLELRLGDRTFRMSPLTERDIAELDHWLQSRVIRIARESLPPAASEEDRRLTLDVALSRAASLSWMSPEGARLMATLDGMAQLVWQGVKTNHPGIAPAEIRELLLDAANLEESLGAFDRLNNAKKKRPPSDGPAEKRARRPKRKNHKSRG